MIILHVLNGLYAAGIESLSLQLIAYTPSDVQSELLNLDIRVQDQAPAFAELQRNGRLVAIHQWPRCDGPVLAWRTFLLSRQRRPAALLIYPCNRPMLWLALGARLAGVRRLAVHLGNTAQVDPRGLRTWHQLLLWFQRLGVASVPCSQAIVDSLQPLPPMLRLGPVIANCCDVRDIAERAVAVRISRPPDDAQRVLMVGRLDAIKDQSTLLRAFAAARQPGWELQLVGEGAERPKLVSLCRELGLDPAAVLLGRRSDIPELLGQADLFAFSTTAAEGFGIALIEAMSASLPILASDVPACREVLKDGAAGELVAPGMQIAWSDRLRQLMTNALFRQALSCRAQTYSAMYESRYIASKWYKLLM